MTIPIPRRPWASALRRWLSPLTRRRLSCLVCCGIAATSPSPLRAQKALTDWSITDVCTAEAVGFEADLAPLFDKNDLTVFSIPSFTGQEEVILHAPRPYVLKGFTVVSSDDAQCDLKQLLLQVSDDGQTWRSVRTYNVSFTARQRERQFNGGPSGGFTHFRLAFKANNGATQLRISDIQLLGYPAADDDNLATAERGTITGAAKVRNAMNLIDNVATTMTEIPSADRELIDNFDGETRYNGLQNAWVQYEFREPTPVTAYAIGLTTSANRDRRPSCWELLASNDGEHWTTLDLQHNAASMAVDLYEQRYELGRPGARVDYADVADRLMDFCEQNLERRQGTSGIYWICDWSADPKNVNEDWGGYWWAAHAVDNYLDLYGRTKQNTKLTKISQLLNGTRARNNNTLINHFYDDMEWMALALLRACKMNATLNRQYFNQVKTLFNDIVGGWSDVDGGGIHWNKNTTGDGAGKNSCSNAPAMILAARLYQETQDQQYLDWALRIYEYMRDHNRFPDGVVKDTPQNDNHEVTFSYNQGTWVGGLLELYKITGDDVYRQTATDLMDLLLFGKWYSPHGIMNERQNYNQDDGGLFKGIFIRYLTEWIVSGRLDQDRQFRYAKWLLEQARSAALAAILKPEFIINPYWNQQYADANGTHDTSRQQTGMMLFEAVCLMRQSGILDDDYGLRNDSIGRPFRDYRLNITETQNSPDVMLGSFKLYGPATTAITSPRADNSPNAAGSRAANGSHARCAYDLQGRPSRTAPLLIRNGKKFQNKPRNNDMT